MGLPQFVREYRTVRRAEGWGSTDPAYYTALPYADLSRRHEDVWRIRARSYATFVSRVLLPLEQNEIGASLDVLDVGAGNGWLSHRLAGRGHRVLAIDLVDDAFDGLRALRIYDGHNKTLLPVLAAFDQLPVPDQHSDLVVFNASLHYSTDYARSLRESLRVLRRGGTLVILDSPMYSDPTSGARMVRERESRFSATYGFASNALPAEHFLTETRLSRLESELGVTFTTYQPRLDVRTGVTRRLNGLRARREPARFPVIVATRPW